VGTQSTLAAGIAADTHSLPEAEGMSLSRICLGRGGQGEHGPGSRQRKAPDPSGAWRGLAGIARDELGVTYALPAIFS